MTSTSHHSSASSSSSSEEEGEECTTVEVSSYHVPHTTFSEVLCEELLLKSTKGPQVIGLIDAALQANITTLEILQFNDSVVQAICTVNSSLKKWEGVAGQIMEKFSCIEAITFH